MALVQPVLPEAPQQVGALLPSSEVVYKINRCIKVILPFLSVATLFIAVFGAQGKISFHAMSQAAIGTSGAFALLNLYPFLLASRNLCTVRNQIANELLPGIVRDYSQRFPGVNRQIVEQTAQEHAHIIAPFVTNPIYKLELINIGSHALFRFMYNLAIVGVAIFALRGQVTSSQLVWTMIAPSIAGFVVTGLLFYYASCFAIGKKLRDN